MRFGVFPAAMLIFAAVHARAQGMAPSGPSGDRVLTDGSRAPGEAAAHEHFERALVWYRAGKYHLAIEELDAALDRDPGGKDLVFQSCFGSREARRSRRRHPLVAALSEHGEGRCRDRARCANDPAGLEGGARRVAESRRSAPSPCCPRKLVLFRERAANSTFGWPAPGLRRPRYWWVRSSLCVR